MGKRGHGAWVKDNEAAILQALHNAIWTSPDQSSSTESWKFVKGNLQHWPPEKVAYIMRNGNEKMDVKEAIVHQPGLLPPRSHVDLDRLDGYPGASIVYPMSSNQWAEELAKVVLVCTFRLADFIAMASVDVDIIRGRHPQTPVHLRIGFVAASIAAFLFSVALAAWRTWQEARKQSGWRSASGIEVVRTFAPKLFLRYLGISHKILNFPADMYVAASRLATKELLEYPTMPLRVDMSRTERLYNKTSGFYALLPRVIFEDWLLGAIKFSMFTCAEQDGSLTVALAFSATMGLGHAINSLVQARTYVGAVLDFDEELNDFLAKGDLFNVKGRLDNLPSLCGFRVRARSLPILRKVCGCQLELQARVARAKPPFSFIFGRRTAYSEAG